jgi:biopolymer transport protein ExbB
MNYLGITASIAPMLGFLGTIFGVIQIFYNISATGDLNIAAISDGLYQKMICSGAGLLVGIVAYSGFYILNGRIDKVVLNIDKSSNDILKAIKAAKRGDTKNEVE